MWLPASLPNSQLLVLPLPFPFRCSCAVNSMLWDSACDGLPFCRSTRFTRPGPTRDLPLRKGI
jgi:hypothetical protein